MEKFKLPPPLLAPVIDPERLAITGAVNQLGEI